MCAYHDQERVSSEELVQLLIAVAELKGDESSSASLIAQTIMKFDKRQKDDKITKEEFISQYMLRFESVLEKNNPFFYFLV